MVEDHTELRRGQPVREGISRDDGNAKGLETEEGQPVENQQDRPAKTADSTEASASDIPSAFSKQINPLDLNTASKSDSVDEDFRSPGVEAVDDESELNFDLRGDEDNKTSTRFRSVTDHQGPDLVDLRGHKMHKYSLYETRARFYLVGGDLADQNFRILKIDRTAPPGQLNLVEDEVIYNKKEMSDLLMTVQQGNQAVGGMKLKGNSWGLLGFIRFTEAYYMLMITGKQPIALIGGHYIYKIEDTDLIPLTTGSTSRFQSNRNAEEQRHLGILHNLDLNHCFYFSNSYNVTRTLQHNTIYAMEHPREEDHVRGGDLNDMFVWNYHLLDPAIGNLKNPFDWCTPVIHGFVDQTNVDVFGKSVWVTLIARRSRFFAGARFLKRGVNDLGYVANDVETEQIVADLQTTPLRPPSINLRAPTHSSFVQHRGSIPLYWTQDTTGVTPKPGIELNFIDPFYAAAALHFDDLFQRYGAPIVVLNLVRSRERTPREVKLLVEYQNAIAYLNQPLPPGKRILYRAFDMARAAKNKGQNVIASLESIAHELVRTTAFFHNGPIDENGSNVQNGVTRSNCIDCLDRTNACQFVIGKTAFAFQLQALGIIAGDHLNYDCDATNVLAHMYNNHGDTLASQYGGSHLVNTTDSYRRPGNWQSHSRDMLESFKRYYHNSFLDSQRQEAYNLFLGNYRYASGQPMLWDLPTDYYLHHTKPSSLADLRRRDYIKWFTPAFLAERRIPDDPMPTVSNGYNAYNGHWWREYYRPSHLTTFGKTFAYRLNSSTKYMPKPSSQQVNKSPFIVRRHLHEQEAIREGPEDEVGFTDVNSRRAINPLSATLPPQVDAKRITSLQHWLNEGHEEQVLSIGAGRGLENPHATPLRAPGFVPPPKATMKQWTVRQFHDNSLNPYVTDEEQSFYEAYVKSQSLIDMNNDATIEEHQMLLENAGAIAQIDDESGTLGSKAEYQRWLTEENPLTVREEDLEKKRFQAYAKWLRGKSLFKQSKVDPEYTRGQ